MSAKGYCTTAEIESFLGVTFTAGQVTQCAAQIEATEVAFDRESNRAWLTGAIVDEAHWWPARKLFVNYSPMATLTSVKGRLRGLTTDDVLVAGDDYEVIFLATGEIYIFYPQLYNRIKVSYTPVATVPADIRQAIIEWVAAQMQPSLNPDSFGVEKITMPDYSIQYSKAVLQGVMPPAVAAVARGYRFEEGF